MMDQQITAVNEGPLVSVIIPAYNAENFIAETLKSVLDQTYKNIEVIVVDDGSQDRTVVIVEKFIASDQRVKLLKQVNSGVAVARNTAIEHAQGEFIAPIDADDIWYPENIAKQVDCFGRSPANVGLVYSWSVHIDVVGNLTSDYRAENITGNVYTYLIWHNFIDNGSATMIRRSVFHHIGLYDYQLREQQAQGCEDWDLYLRIAEFYHFAVVPEFLVGYRKMPHTLSKDYEQMARSHDLMLKANEIKHPEIPAIIYRISRSTFYLYLAKESYYEGGNSYYIGYFLKKIWQIDSVTPLFRPIFYQLIIVYFYQNLLSYFASQQLIADQTDHQRQKLQNRHENSFQLSKILTTSDFPYNQFHLKIKSLVSQLLYQLTPPIEQKQDLSLSTHPK